MCSAFRCCSFDNPSAIAAVVVAAKAPLVEVTCHLDLCSGPKKLAIVAPVRYPYAAAS